MPTVTIYNLSRPLPEPLQVRYCDAFLCRLRGLMLHPPLGRNGGLIMAQKRENRADAAIHMFFMRMDLTVIWLNAAFEVVDVRLARRWRPAYAPAKPAKYIIETSVSWLSAFQTGDQLRMEAG